MLKLLLCGAAALFWELVLIRWTGSCVRIVAYYSNVVLISAFLGLGAGALLARHRFALWKSTAAALALCVVLGPVLGSFSHANPTSPEEFVWIGGPEGIVLDAPGAFFGWSPGAELPFWLVLGLVYATNTFVFACFGQWLGLLFKRFGPLKAYAVEIAGSVLGIVLFAVVSFFELPPPVWFTIGFVLLLPVIERARERLLALACGVAAILLITPFAGQFLWSPYYKIRVSPLDRVLDTSRTFFSQYSRPFGYALTVNNDFHQMMLDLHPRPNEPEFLRSWRRVYDLPYAGEPGEPDGPILIVGAGTGNDVSAALRNTTALIDAVEIDPAIARIGRRQHFEHPYADPRVRLVVDDARSFFAHTERRYARVVFGFLDSHTLLSSFSSIRLDNFVYTREAMEQVKQLLLPGGRVVLTFASNTRWLHERMIGLLGSVFDDTTVVTLDRSRFVNGVVYRNLKRGPADRMGARAPPSRPSSVLLPTDDWPYLYMKSRSLPAHYRIFMAMVVLSGVGAFLLLPRGRRRIGLPYFFLGAGFFLLETCNVVALSLLYGSTWVVNVTVFTSILVLILLGTVLCMRPTRLDLRLAFGLLGTSLLVAYLTPTASLLVIQPRLLQGAIAGFVFLAPVFFASLIFGHLIREEPDLYRAYGSNLLGAVLGGALEYFSLVTGIKAMFLIAMALYVAAFLALSPFRSRAAAA